MTSGQYSLQKADRAIQDPQMIDDKAKFKLIGSISKIGKKLFDSI
jgi:hypothetical protein